MSEEEKSPIDRLFDEDDTSPISLFNEKGEEVKFDQIALIPIEEQVYAILKPIEQMEGIGEDEALVFEIVENESDEGDSEYLNLVSDIDIIDKVLSYFSEYTAEDLTDWTMREGFAWQKTSDTSVYWGNEIPDSYIEKDFKKFVKTN